MTTRFSEPNPSNWAMEELSAIASKVAGSFSASRLWRRLKAPDRKRLGDDMGAAYEQNGGTAGMWQKLRGVSPYRAVLDVGKKVGFVTLEDYEQLLDEIGECDDFEEAIVTAVARRDLVLVERPRAAHWNGREIDVDWEGNPALWEFFWELASHAKAGQAIDSTVFGERASSDIVAKRKYRLTRMEEFPIELTDSINVVDRGTQQLEIPSESIRIFEVAGPGTLREWFP